MGAILLITVLSINKWFFPYTMDDLERQIACVGDIIEQNTALERDLLGDMGWIFRDQLDGERRNMGEIQEWAIAEPNRWDLLAWIRFRWREMKEVKRCYCSVLDLRKNVLVCTRLLTTLEERQLTIYGDIAFQMEVNQRRHDLLQYPA
ncbi:hypothetical protein PQX77_018674 [Marasmius sp. AFHP31]|nr:hypothetical protein PQX77_018674 [Marasmius sp. AFHP31]